MWIAGSSIGTGGPQFAWRGGGGTGGGGGGGGGLVI